MSPSATNEKARSPPTVSAAGAAAGMTISAIARAASRRNIVKLQQAMMVAGVGGQLIVRTLRVAGRGWRSYTAGLTEDKSHVRHALDRGRCGWPNGPGAGEDHLADQRRGADRRAGGACVAAAGPGCRRF